MYIAYGLPNHCKEMKIKLKISNAPKVRKPSCEHMDGQCLVI